MCTQYRCKIIVPDDSCIVYTTKLCLLNCKISHHLTWLLSGELWFYGGLRPGYLTHWKKWYPSLFSSLKITPFFEAKCWLFSSYWPLFRDKTLTFQPKRTPHFHIKTLDIKTNPFFSKFTEVSTKIPLFLGKCESWISSKNTPLFANIRTRMRVVK